MNGFSQQENKHKSTSIEIATDYLFSCAILPLTTKIIINIILLRYESNIVEARYYDSKD